MSYMSYNTLYKPYTCHIYTIMYASNMIITWSYTSYLTVTHIYDIQLGDTSLSLADSSLGVDIITKYHKMPVSNNNITIHLLYYDT